MTSTTVSPDAMDFFRTHAGYSFDPTVETAEEGRERGARAMAEAETWAAEQGITFAWEDDWEVGSHAKYYGRPPYFVEPETCEHVAAFDPGGNVLASLGCVDDATTEYRRVVQAELALEALGDAQDIQHSVDAWLALG